MGSFDESVRNSVPSVAPREVQEGRHLGTTCETFSPSDYESLYDVSLAGVPCGLRDTEESPIFRT